MKLKTRLLITFLISVFIPLFLMVFSFWTICVYLIQNGIRAGIKVEPQIMNGFKALIDPDFLLYIIIIVIVTIID